MSELNSLMPDDCPAGYAWLTKRYALEVIPNWHNSRISGSARRTHADGHLVQETFPASHWPGNGLGDHLTFALKYDGVNLAILSLVFQACDQAELTRYIKSKPTGQYTRRLWFFYEFLTGKELPIGDVKTGNYVKLLDEKKYFTATRPINKFRRQRVIYNMTGNTAFCPLVRRTEILEQCVKADLPARCREVIADYSDALLHRVLGYLYSKETKSSFEIEHETLSADRTERFVALLQSAENEDFCDTQHLIELQNRIVDPRFAATGYRSTQNYVGETIDWQHEKIHFVCPKPQDIERLMDGLVNASSHMKAGLLHPVIHAAMIAYGFVFLHPFEDGNGRIHRFLIHNILANRQFTPEGFIFPVSAAMLKDPVQYDSSLEAFSKPLLSCVNYTLDQEGLMTVTNETAVYYRYMDMTAQAETLFSFIKTTIETDLVDELRFLTNYDRSKAAVQNIVDMPDRLIDLFLRFCLQNQGRLSARKRSSHFAMLTDDEIERMEEAIQAED